ncbi:MAG: hypothetical protein A2Z95_01180 [Gallionellales bacterium GWA2_60_18]|nr:MAG: hypothetical protein A2Z95_01180 [Gallionellales bacterium GWA2_60_18]
MWHVLAVSALLLGAFGLSQQAVAGIADTKHNLGTTNTEGGNHVTAGTGEICVFCHTPHAADTSAPVPLWNKQLNSAGGYTSYSTLNSSTIDAQFATDGAGGESVGSISLACLSCHDGTQAMDNIINAPGSGGYSATGGGANGLAYTWAGTQVDVNGKMTNAATTLAMLGTDLSNDHPIGMQYCGGGPTQASPATACNDGDFVAPESGTLGADVKLWVDTSVGVDGTREKTDMILYNRTFAAGVGPSVECASCHDPHTSAQATFLRVSNTGSGVCLSCHVK